MSSNQLNAIRVLTEIIEKLGQVTWLTSSNSSASYEAARDSLRAAEAALKGIATEEWRWS